MPIRTAKAQWNGGVKKGTGRIELGSGSFKGQYSFSSRFESGKGTNPEELIAGAHAGCFSMALSLFLEQGGFKPDTIETTAGVSIDPQGGGFAITGIELSVEAKVPGIDDAKFKEIAEKAKVNCPVSKALGGVKIALKAKLLK